MASIVATTLLTSGSATLLASLIGIPLGAKCARRGGLSGLRMAVRTLYGLPPVVVGVLVYLALSNRGPLSELDLLFTVPAMILAQTLLVLPLVWGGTWSAFDAITEGHREALDLLALDARNRLRVEVGLVWRGVLNGVALGFGRAIAEVGSVLMVGGNIAGQTRVLTTSIVLETSRGDLGAAVAQGGLLLLLALAAMFLIEGLRMVRPRGAAGRSPQALPDAMARAHDGYVWPLISIKRKGVTVLDVEEVVVRGGEILVVMGASGAGKSTLLRAIAGLLADVEGVPVKRGRGGVGRVAQHPVMLTSHPAAEVELVDPARAGLLEGLGLDEVAERPAAVLSGGERQRVSLARALALTPSVLILDEFTSGLDLPTTLAVEAVVRRAADEGAVVVLATHDLAQARRLGDRRMLLAAGRLVDEGSETAALLLGEVQG
ncbi:MAG TPA: ATP-binding cassette domain-containing protein [Candidatus Poseidoniaceae archaeon]|nr:MAG TPA: ATP-binding cassette domain-containing protein [Candidatus Poseidoniales archaeon]HIH53384.1 ATP-binding cassette domain-containing protein [Candidatus Poseidoniaceae archaeon]